MTYEHDRALMEGARNSACDDYFSARPQIDTIDRRRVYETGFQAGAASRDAEVAMWVERVNSWTRDCERLADERDQLRTEMNEWRGQAHRSQSDADRLREENDQLRVQINVLRGLMRLQPRLKPSNCALMAMKAT